MENRFDDIRKKIYGPVFPVPPAFDEPGNLDTESVISYTKHLCRNHARILMVTAGTSRLSLLNFKEIAALNQAVAQAAAGSDVLTIGGLPPFGSTKMVIELARKAVKDGCNALLIYYPDKFYSDDAVYEYYVRIALESDSPLMIHGVPFQHGRCRAMVPYSIDLCCKLAEIENVVGMKEEFGSEELRYKLATRLGQRIPLIVAGGSMRKYLGSTLYGIRSWLVGVGSFFPKIEQSFFDIVQSGDYAAALEIVKHIEEPFFDIAMPIGWHVAMRSMLSILGLMPEYERKPMVMAEPEQRNQLISIAHKLGWLPFAGGCNDRTS